MKNYLIFLIVVSSLLKGNSLLGQSNYSQMDIFSFIAGYMKEDKIYTEQINNQTYEVWLKKDKSFVPKLYSVTGTCFFIRTHFDNYLVTAEHVAKSMSNNSFVTVSSENHDPITIKLKDMVKDTTKLSWTIHPIADVAVIQLDTIKTDKIIPFMLFEDLNYKLESPFREEEVTVFGYPLSLGVGKKFSSISKTLKPSSGLIELPRFDNKIKTDFYLLDDPSVSGFSGGPVVLLQPVIGNMRFGNANIENTNKIVGLVHGTINDKGGGFAAIVPSFYIKETIELAPGFNGLYTFKYPDGKIWSERIYNNGMPYTVLSNYDSNGNTQEKGTLKNGNGSLYIYDEKNKLTNIYHYKEEMLYKVEVPK